MVILVATKEGYSWCFSFRFKKIYKSLKTKEFPRFLQFIGKKKLVLKKTGSTDSATADPITNQLKNELLIRGYLS